MKNKGQILDTIVIRIQSSPTGPVSPARTLSVITDITDELYSYIVYTEYKDDTLIGWKCQFCVSHTSTYNCLLSYDCVIEIVKLIQESYASAASTSHKYIIGYKQAPLPVLLSILEPLTNSVGICSASALASVRVRRLVPDVPSLYNNFVQQRILHSQEHCTEVVLKYGANEYLQRAICAYLCINRTVKRTRGWPSAVSD